MIDRSRVVSIHPYFKVKPGKLEEARAILRKFVERAAGETEILHYDFTLRDDVVFCREAYIGAEGLLTHLANVGEVLQEMLGVADVARLEVHGSASELAKLESSLGPMNPEWYVFECGLER